MVKGPSNIDTLSLACHEEPKQVPCIFVKPV